MGKLKAQRKPFYYSTEAVAAAMLQLIRLTGAGMESRVHRSPASRRRSPRTNMGEASNTKASLFPHCSNAPRPEKVTGKEGRCLTDVAAAHASPIPGRTALCKPADETVCISKSFAITTKHKAMNTTVTRKLLRNRARGSGVSRNTTKFCIQDANITGAAPRPD